MLTGIRFADNRAVDSAVTVALLVCAGAAIFAPDWLISVTPDCLISRILGEGVCWGCGITRAVVNLVHFRYSAAMAANPLVIMVAPGLAWIVFNFFMKLYRAERERYR